VLRIIAAHQWRSSPSSCPHSTRTHRTDLEIHSTPDRARTSNMKSVVVHPLPTLTAEIVEESIPVPKSTELLIKVVVAGSNVKGERRSKLESYTKSDTLIPLASKFPRLVSHHGLEAELQLRRRSLGNRRRDGRQSHGDGRVQTRRQSRRFPRDAQAAWSVRRVCHRPRVNSVHHS
jgi:hypothetical protein